MTLGDVARKKYFIGVLFHFGQKMRLALRSTTFQTLCIFRTSYPNGFRFGKMEPFHNLAATTNFFFQKFLFKNWLLTLKFTLTISPPQWSPLVC